MHRITRMVLGGAKTLALSLLVVGAISFIPAPALADEAGRFPDWAPATAEEQQVCDWLAETRAMIGFADGTFRPWDIVTSSQVIRVCDRLNLASIDELSVGCYPASMGWVSRSFLPGTIHSAPDHEFCTRYRFATMLYRHSLVSPKPAAVVSVEEDSLGALAGNLNQWFDEMYWNGRQNRFVGLGWVFVEESTEHSIPISLALGCGWAESCWGAGDNPNYNMAFGIKDNPDYWGEIRGTVISGFGDYATMEECVRAYFNYMDGRTRSDGTPLYRAYIDEDDWYSIICIYSPPYENDVGAMHSTYRTVERWCHERGID